MSKFDFITKAKNTGKFTKESLPRCENEKVIGNEIIQCNKPASVKYVSPEKTILYLCDSCDASINGLNVEGKLNKREAKNSDNPMRWIVHEGFIFDRDRGSTVALISSRNNQSPFPEDVAEKIAEIMNEKWTNVTFDTKKYSNIMRLRKK